MSKTMSCSEKTKLKMGNALKELVVNDGFEKITVSDITNKCKIHRQTFYYHFQDKYELLDWLLYIELLEPFIEDFCFENMYDKLYEIFIKIYSDKRFYKNAFRVANTSLNKYVSEIAKKQFIDMVARIGTENGVSVDISNNTIVAEFIGFGVSGIVYDWVRRDFEESPEELKEKVICIINSCKELVINRMNK